MSGSYKFEKIASLDKSILIANPDLELHRNQVKIPLYTPDAKLLKCFDWISNYQEMIALGYSFGRVLLGRLIEEKLEFITEFVPKHSRSCIDVAFCPINSKLLATALDKVRNDCGLNVWDIEHCTFGGNFQVSQFKGSTSSLHSNNERPLASYGSSEGISSMAWFYDSANIIAGMSQKWIRLFDLRDTMSSSLIFSTRAVQGITTDPFSANRWASFSDDGIVRMFDIRKVGEPVLSFSPDFKNGIKQISWDKSRSGILGVIGRDSPIIKIFEIQDVSHSIDAYGDEDDIAEEEVPILTSKEKFTCFTWEKELDKGTSTLLLLAESIIRVTMPDTLPSVISPVGHVGITQHGNFIEVAIPNLDDISFKMLQRSVKGYNLNAERNLTILDDQSVSLRGVWTWIKNLEKYSDMFVNGSKDYAREGLFSLVEASIRDAEDSFSNTIDSKNTNFPFISYNSSMRRKCLLMVGWEFYVEDPIESKTLIDAKINASIDAGNYEEAAAISFFHALDLTKTTNALMKSPEERLKLIAISVASLEISKSSSNWKSMCGSISIETKNPFLRSIFGLIASSGDVYAILNDKELSLRDKLGIAFRLLNDQMLLEYLSKLMTKMMLVGEVQSIIFYGLSEMSINVLSNYLDYSGDIQTVALLSSFIHEPVYHDQIKNWILSYRELLDRWRHFDRRAEFDICRPKFTVAATEKDPGRLSLRCNYCSGPIVMSSHAASDISNCQKCRKPLPRCAICLINMGISINESKEPIADWFTFCIKCKHGGHVSHIKQWFSLNEECPVWNCSCTCQK